jgi:hypothetical protein
LFLRRHPFLSKVYGTLGLGAAALFRRHPLSRGPEEITPPPFFIIGAARSGNTLLRAMLASHSAVAIPPESFVLPYLVDRWDRINFLPWEDLTKLVIATFESHPAFHTWGTDLLPVHQWALALGKKDRSLAAVVDLIYRRYSTERFPGAGSWGDKTPLNTENVHSIERLFPGARYIHILRDGRDAVSSGVAAGLYDGDVARVSHMWLLRVRSARKLGRRLHASRYVEIRYEELVRHPRPALERVCQYLGLAFEEGMLKPHELFDTLGDTTHYSHYANLAKPVTSSSIGTWRERLTDEQRVIVEKILGATLEELGYLGSD